MKVLFVTRELNVNYDDGGLKVSRINYDFITEYFGIHNVDTFVIDKPSAFQSLVNLLLCKGYGQNKKNWKDFKNKLDFGEYDLVFFNSSIYGSFVKYAAKKKIKTMVFFHNIEKKFYKHRFSSKFNIQNLLYYFFISKNEKQVVENSIYRIAINERDAKNMYTVYKKEASYVLPLSLKSNTTSSLKKENTVKNYALFVGSNFYANIDGLSWFIDNVLNKINYDLYIVGSVCESLKSKYSAYSKVHLCGYVDDLARWYNSAAFVVSPIFSGSGMKTKTVEALAYGKTIFSTDEGFVGMNHDFDKIGGKCNSADEFIEKINLYNTKNFLNEYSLNVFNEYYSYETVKTKFFNFLARV